MWLESSGGNRVEGLRLEEARGTGAGIVATACPFCKIMLETAAVTAGRQDEIAVRDISEIVSAALEVASIVTDQVRADARAREGAASRPEGRASD